MKTAGDAITEVTLGEGTPSGDDRQPKCTWHVTTPLDRAYSKFVNETAEVQLAKAGLRLAALLVAIFEGR